MKPFIFCVALILFPLLFASAQNRPIDYQFRFLTHYQNVDSGKTFGTAAWGIIPDATQKMFKCFMVAGVMAKSDSTKWIEIMGGGYIKSDGNFLPAVDVRSSISLKYGVSAFTEVLYLFRERRLILLPNITENLRVGDFKIRIGGESDIILERGRRPLYGFGPRMVISWPWRLSKISLATGYQRTNGSFDILRSYLLLNF